MLLNELLRQGILFAAITEAAYLTRLRGIRAAPGP